MGREAPQLDVQMDASRLSISRRAFRGRHAGISRVHIRRLEKGAQRQGRCCFPLFLSGRSSSRSGGGSLFLKDSVGSDFVPGHRRISCRHIRAPFSPALEAQMAHKPLRGGMRRCGDGRQHLLFPDSGYDGL